MNTFRDGGMDQLAKLVNFMQQADERGYVCMMMEGDVDSTHTPYEPLCAAFQMWLANWGYRYGRRCIVIDVWGSNGKFRFRVPRRKVFMPVIASLGLVSKRYDPRSRDYTGPGVLQVQKQSDWMSYSGSGAQQLKIAVKILETHKEILIGEFKTRPS